MKLACVVDGFNLYRSVTDAIEQGSPSIIKWLNVRSLCESRIEVFGAGKIGFDRTVYCTALVGSDQSPERMRQKLFIKANMQLGIDVKYGYFKQKPIKCRKCHGTYYVPVEKQTDLNIGISVVEAFLDDFDGCMLVSGDSDLESTLLLTSNRFKKKCAVVLPYLRTSSRLNMPRFSPQNLSADDYYNHILPNPVFIDGRQIKAPKYWETGQK